MNSNFKIFAWVFTFHTFALINCMESPSRNGSNLSQQIFSESEREKYAQVLKDYADHYFISPKARDFLDQFPKYRYQNNEIILINEKLRKSFEVRVPDQLSKEQTRIHIYDCKILWLTNDLMRIAQNETLAQELQLPCVLEDGDQLNNIFNGKIPKKAKKENKPQEKPWWGSIMQDAKNGKLQTSEVKNTLHKLEAYTIKKRDNANTVLINDKLPNIINSEKREVTLNPIADPTDLDALRERANEVKQETYESQVDLREASAKFYKSGLLKVSLPFSVIGAYIKANDKEISSELRRLGKKIKTTRFGFVIPTLGDIGYAAFKKVSYAIVGSLGTIFVLSATGLLAWADSKSNILKFAALGVGIGALGAYLLAEDEPEQEGPIEL